MLAIPPFVHLDEEAKKQLVGTVMPSAEVWVVEIDGAVSGVLVLNGNWIAQLYIDPGWTNHGLGTALIERAKVEHPEVLELWTFESNRGSQRFYERHGFRGNRWRQRRGRARHPLSVGQVSAMRFDSVMIGGVQVPPLRHRYNTRAGLTRWTLHWAECTSLGRMHTTSRTQAYGTDIHP